MKKFIKYFHHSAPDSIKRRLYIQTVIIALFLFSMILIAAWTRNTLTVITAIARFERTHTVSRLEAKASLLEYLDTRMNRFKTAFFENMAVTQSYNRVFGDLLTMRTSKTEDEFVQIIENTFKEADHKTAVIIVNRIKNLYWHPIIREMVELADQANHEGETIIKLASLAMTADKSIEEQHSLLDEITNAEQVFISYEHSFSTLCTDLANEISTFADYFSLAVLILSIGFTIWLTYLLTRSLLKQAVRHARDLEESRKLYRNLVEGTADLITRVDIEGRLVFVNHIAQKLFGLPPEKCIGRLAVDFIHPDDKESTIAAFQAYFKGGKEIFTHENRLVDIDGLEHHMAWSNIAEKDENFNVTGFASTARDITEKKIAEQEQEKLKVQLIQARKMESVGRLAGGVAHDFNNMLTIILGNSEMILEDMDPAGPFAANLQQIYNAAERSANLTRQLLAFARKQTIAPKVLNLNKTLEEMLTMLKRLIGEDIDLIWLPAKNLKSVKIDATQVDQILANLCVNSRDAIKSVGKITIETGNIFFDEEYVKENPGFKKGYYVLIAFSDNGSGMDKVTLENLFEPFFTTKEVGQGSGLGLATVYGIVKQNDGFINVYSEPGKGTTFKIYLPQYFEKIVSKQKKPLIMNSMTGKETILLVEDEESILYMTKKLLEKLGYTVLDASTPNEAIRIVKESRFRTIHLLITDVVMPEMNGRDLSKKILMLYPEIKCLFMSGYTANVIAHHGVLDTDIQFINKPFSKQDLAAKIREVLDEEKGSVHI